MTESIARASTGAPLLSICISTFNRADWIGETLAGLMAQVTPQVEVVIVDGASTDGTQAVVQSCMQTWPSIVYPREAENSGVDRDFDKAVQAAIRSTKFKPLVELGRAVPCSFKKQYRFRLDG